MLTPRNALTFVIFYCIISAFLFGLAILVWPGFPFFPKRIYQTTSEISTVTLDKGNYQVLLFVERAKSLEVKRGKIGTLKIIPINGRGEAISVNDEDYYFDYSRGKDGLKGHAIGSFNISSPTEIAIENRFLEFGYDGLIIRTGFGPMFISILFFEISVLLLTLTLIWIKMLIKKDKPLTPMK